MWMMHEDQRALWSMFGYHCSEAQLKQINTFIFLKKEECKLAKHLFKRFPKLTDRYDEEGNNPSLYACLRVRGSEHRLLQVLIEMGCDYRQKNTRGGQFIDAIRRRKIEKLMKNLIEHGVIHIDDTSDQMAILETRRFQ